MELVDTTVEQGLVSSAREGRNRECVDSVGGVSEAGCGGMRGVKGGCAARRSTSPLAAAPRGHTSPCVKVAPAEWAAAGGGEDRLCHHGALMAAPESVVIDRRCPAPPVDDRAG